jgi:hypothetical protein
VPANRDATLARLIRRSRALDAQTRRHWLAVLPHLEAEDRERLRTILLDAEVRGDPPAEAGPRPAPRPARGRPSLPGAPMGLQDRRAGGDDRGRDADRA